MPETTKLTLPVLPLRNGVVFPHMVVTLTIDSDEGATALAAAGGTENRILLVPRVGDTYARVGTIAEIQDVSGGAGVVVRGLARARVGAGRRGEDGALWVDAEELPDMDFTDAALEEMVAEYRATVSEVLELRGMGQVAERILGIDHPGQLADLAAYSPDLSLEQKVELLETADLHERFGKLMAWMTDVLGELTLRRRVREDAAERMEKSQREYVLRQQLDAIRSELDEGGDDVIAEYRKRLGEANFPEHVAEAIEREIDRLERMNEQSPEHGWIRTWLDTTFELPFGVFSEDTFDLAASRQVLNDDHAGLDDVKERIIEHLAVRKLRAERGIESSEGDRRSGAILLLVGPPGVGKTSLGESVARALGRRFVRVALGGLRDEAEIRGHRRTYVGARPGRIARALIDAGSMNPVFLLDEMDKVGSDWRGDPSSALLEVLDPAQNHTFRDHYLEYDLDLSDVLFVATANLLDTIPAPLLDRTEVIRIDGYTDAEKVAIGRDHLARRQLRSAGLTTDEVSLTEGALEALVDGYTREAGVRGLERQLGKLARKVATKIATGELAGPVEIDAEDLVDLVGKPTVHHDEVADRTAVPGVATGLAVTGAGGDVLFIEASAMGGEPGLTLTGQLGDVMKESAQIALSYVRANAARLGIADEAFDRKIHLHVPAGAIPKDGPSAGITMVTALTSLLTDQSVKETVGMTGEVTLQGAVLPIGGLKQKVLAAYRAGITEVVVPARNEIDLDDVPAEVREAITFHVVSSVPEVLAVALAPVLS